MNFIDLGLWSSWHLEFRQGFTWKCLRLVCFWILHVQEPVPTSEIVKIYSHFVLMYFLPMPCPFWRCILVTNPLWLAVSSISLTLAFKWRFLELRTKEVRDIFDPFYFDDETVLVCQTNVSDSPLTHQSQYIRAFATIYYLGMDIFGCAHREAWYQNKYLVFCVLCGTTFLGVLVFSNPGTFSCMLSVSCNSVENKKVATWGINDFLFDTNQLGGAWNRLSQHSQSISRFSLSLSHPLRSRPQ